MIRQVPPLNLSGDIETPDGRHHRLAWDEPKAQNVPTGLSFSTVLSGGFERCSFTLERDPRLSYPDLAPLSTLTLYGPGGGVAWQGRIEKIPDTAGFESQVTPELVGWQAALEDDNTVREIYIDQELSKWTGPTIARKIELLNFSYDQEDASVAPGPESLPALVTQMTAPWNRHRLSEGWYDAKGIQIGKLDYAWRIQAANKIGDAEASNPHFFWSVFLAQNEEASGGANTPGALWPLRDDETKGGGTQDSTGGTDWAIVQLSFDEPTTTEGVQYPIFWTNLAVFGTHGLPAYGTPDGEGLRASAIVNHAVARWASGLEIGFIEQTDFPVPQLVFLEATTVAEVIKQATRFDLPDWAVWEGPTFHMKGRDKGWGGARTPKNWRARIGSAQLQQTGPQVSAIYNGVIVNYADSAGIARTIGPPGSGAEVESGQLADSDPENPANVAKIRRWGVARMGSSTLTGAEQLGAIFLRESRRLDTSGQATLVGHVEDSAGTLWPAWKVRAGDTISFLDAADSSPRRIVHTSYDDSTRSNTLQLDQPPDSMTALLERLSISLVGIGLS